jgi:dihydropteroate synthase
MASTKLMAILNITSDSFYAKSRVLTLSDAIQRAMTLEAEGADILDIGGESTRPGAAEISEKEEIERVIPLIRSLNNRLSIPISIDTSKPEVAKEAIAAGARLINDVTGFSNLKMKELAVQHELEIVVMHMRGTPKTMQMDPYYPEGIIKHLINWFEKKIENLITQGIKQEKIILDPGIGFGKTVADNLKIIHNLHEFKRLGFRILLGTSRKSFLSKMVRQPSDDLLSATLAINTIAIMAQTDIIRVHDVKEHRSAIDTIAAYAAY